MFMGLATEGGDLPWFAAAIAPSTHPGNSDSETAYRHRWTALSTAFNGLITPGRPTYNPAISLQVRTANEESNALLGSRPNLFDLRKDFSSRLLKYGILEKVIELANKAGSKPISEIPARLIVSEEIMKSEPGIMAVGPEKTVPFPCENIFMFCAGSRKISIPKRADKHLSSCRATHFQLLENSTYKEKFNQILEKIYEDAKNIDVASSTQIGTLMSQFFSLLEARGLAETLENETKKGE